MEVILGANEVNLGDSIATLSELVLNSSLDSSNLSLNGIVELVIESDEFISIGRDNSGFRSSQLLLRFINNDLQLGFFFSNDSVDLFRLLTTLDQRRDLVNKGNVPAVSSFCSLFIVVKDFSSD